MLVDFKAKVKYKSHPIADPVRRREQEALVAKYYSILEDYEDDTFALHHVIDHDNVKNLEADDGFDLTEFKTRGRYFV